MPMLRNVRQRIRSFFTWAPYQLVSYSQEGEDLILARIFGLQKSGFYVDVGAHHPQRFSNTYLFYRKGWRGINIDAMPGSMVPFRKIRPRDVNLEIPVMRTRGRLTYYKFNEPALNGFSKELSESRDGRGGYKIVGKTEIEGAPLREILEKHLAAGTEIDFLSIDVEGLDIEVLQSNDWSRFRPKVVLVEILVSSLTGMQTNDVFRLLEAQRYQVFAKALNTVFFLSEEYLRKRNSEGS
jgi:FkbM family methyltransferase